MHRRLVIGLALGVLALPAWAQYDPADMQPGPRARQRAEVAEHLRGVDELRFIADSLTLDEKQKQHAEGLIDEYRQAVENRSEDQIGHIADLLTQISQAQKDGNTEQVEALKTQLTEAQPARKGRRDFIEGLRQILNDDQKAELDRTLAWLEKNPSGKLRPLEVYVLASKLDLTPEQRSKLNGVHSEFRTNVVGKTRDLASIPTSGIDVDFAKAVRAILTPAQAEEFDKQIKAISPTLLTKMLEPATESTSEKP
ncbi:MAG: Spy/CpxP family protein refolding chaperone [Phycisphaerae bacterium]|nr:Spy/CpxP family protein refolding chaperone [Phycisphaerae bacterium]